MTTPTEAMVKAADTLYQALTENHPELPAVVFVVGYSGRKKNSQVHGHFAPATWEGGAHEIFLSGESLGRGAEATATTIIHEAAHALGYARDIGNTSNQGRYHNGEFKKLGEELGLTVEKDPEDTTRGYNMAEMTEETKAKYAYELKLLKAALTTHRVVQTAPAPKPKKSTVVKLDCQCDHPFNMNRKWWDENAGSLSCRDCFEDYKEVTE